MPSSNSVSQALQNAKNVINRIPKDSEIGEQPDISSTIEEKLQLSFNTKEQIFLALKEKGVSVTLSDTLASYADKVKLIKQ